MASRIKFGAGSTYVNHGNVKAGDMSFGQDGQVMVYDGSDWQWINSPESMDNAITKMDGLADSVHEHDERLIEAYNKYKVLRKLILGQ